MATCSDLLPAGLQSALTLHHSTLFHSFHSSPGWTPARPSERPDRGRGGTLTACWGTESRPSSLLFSAAHGPAGPRGLCRLGLTRSGPGKRALPWPRGAVLRALCSWGAQGQRHTGPTPSRGTQLLHIPRLGPKAGLLPVLIWQAYRRPSGSYLLSRGLTLDPAIHLKLTPVRQGIPCVLHML